MPQNQKLNIAFLYDDSLDGSEGVANQVKLLGGWMSARGHKVSYFGGETKLKDWHGGKVYSLAKNVRVRFNGNRLSIPLPAKKAAIRRALAVEKPDILHVQMPHSPFMSQRVIDAAGNTPAVGTFHIFPAGNLVRVGARLLRLAYHGRLSKIGEVVSVSSAAQEFAKSSFKLKTSVVPNMVDIKQFKVQKASIKPNQVVFLGRLVDRKGCAQLIQAFSSVKQHIPEARLVIAGDGPQRNQLEFLAKRLGLGTSVEFLGFVSEQQRRQLLASAAVACFPSLYGESFGIVLIEAMAAGSGVVLAGNNPGYASIMGAIPETMFDPRDPKALGDKILLFLGDNQLSTSVHESQAKLVKQFDVNNVGPQIEALYERAIDKTAGTRHN